MKKLAILLAVILSPIVASAQGAFDSFEGQEGVTSVVVTKNMFKLLAQIDLESDDPEVADYLDLVNNLEFIKIFTTDRPDVAKKMNSSVEKYLNKNSGLSELMRVREDGNVVKFYTREGKNENFVSELLMHVSSTENDQVEAVIMSITGNIDLKQISKLTKDLNVPGSENLKDIDKKKS